MMLTRLLSGAIATAAAAALTLTGLGAAPAQAAQPGQAGSPIVLGTGLTTIEGYDIATDPSSGTAYVGWLSSSAIETNRTVHLCVLPPGATGCQGGVLSTTAIEPSTSGGLHVVVTAPGTATLVWMHGESPAELATSTYAAGALSASTNAGPAPANGTLDDVTMGPDGQIWAVTEDASSSVSNVITVRDGLGATPTSFTAPFPVSAAQLAFNGSQPIVAVSHGSQISDPVRVTSGPAWTPLADVAGTWQIGHDFDVVGTSSGARLISSEADAGYRPVMSVWNGSTFTGAALTGDTNNCAPSSHDLVTDASGRIADVSNECGQITVANLADTRHAGLVRFSAGGTVAGGDPQIGTFANGTGWVAWGIQDSAGDTLQVVPIRLPGQQTAVTATKAKNSVTVTGPASCLPAVSIGDSVSAHAKKGWKLGQLVLTLDGHKVAKTGSIDGSAFASGSTHTLVGKGTFKPKPKKKHHHHGHRSLAQRGSHGHGHGHHHHKTKKKVVTVTLTFRVC